MHLSDGVIGLVGVALGFVLSSGYQECKERRERRRLHKELLNELRANLYLIPLKKDIIQKMITALNASNILPGDGVGFCMELFSNHYGEICQYMSIKERNSIHVIYDYLKTIDTTMGKCADDLMENVETPALRHYMSMYRAKLPDLLTSLDTAKDMIDLHLAGKPDDVFNMDEKPQVVQASGK